MPFDPDDLDSRQPDARKFYEVTVEIGEGGFDEWPDHFASMDFMPEPSAGVARLLVPDDKLAELKRAGLQIEVVGERQAQPLDPRLVFDDAVAVQRTRERLEAILDLGPR